jgi:hypothetical protein
MSWRPEYPSCRRSRENLAAINQAFSLHVQNECVATAATGKM